MTSDPTLDGAAPTRQRPPTTSRPAGPLLVPSQVASAHLQAHLWTVVEERAGLIRLNAHLPDHLLNPMGQLFGGFTPTYVDLVSLHSCLRYDTETRPDQPLHYFSTVNMRIDYFEPITGPNFVVEATIENQRGRNFLVTTRMFQDDLLATYALTTLRRTDVVIPTTQAG